MSRCEQQRKEQFEAFCDQHFLGAAVDVLWELGCQYPSNLILLRDCAGAGGETCQCDLHQLQRAGLQPFPMRRVREYCRRVACSQFRCDVFENRQASEGAGSTGAGGAGVLLKRGTCDEIGSQRRKQFEAYCEKKYLGAAVKVLWQEGYQYSLDLAMLRACAGTGLSATCKCDLHLLQRGGMQPFPMRLLADYLAAQKLQSLSEASGGPERCCICLDQLGSGVSMQLGCKHNLHHKCAEESWLTHSRDMCPVCGPVSAAAAAAEEAAAAAEAAAEEVAGSATGQSAVSATSGEEVAQEVAADESPQEAP